MADLVKLVAQDQIVHVSSVGDRSPKPPSFMSNRALVVGIALEPQLHLHGFLLGTGFPDAAQLSVVPA